jgi:hypothetical protein
MRGRTTETRGAMHYTIRDDDGNATTPTDTGYRVHCACGWTREYPSKAGARGGIAGHQTKPSTHR